MNRCVIATNSLMSYHITRCSQYIIMHNTGGGYLDIEPEIDVMKVRLLWNISPEYFQMSICHILLIFMLTLAQFLRIGIVTSVEYFCRIFLWNISYGIFILHKILWRIFLPNISSEFFCGIFVRNISVV